MEPDGKGSLALRLGFRQLKALDEAEGRWIALARSNGYRAVEDVWRRAGLAPKLLIALAEADTFAALGISRRDAIWAARAIATPAPLPLFARDLDGEGIVEPAMIFREMTLGEMVVADYTSLRLSLRAHPMTLLRRVFTPAEYLVESAKPPSDIESFDPTDGEASRRRGSSAGAARSVSDPRSVSDQGRGAGALPLPPGPPNPRGTWNTGKPALAAH
jgi:DNA polymerase III alpha subunit